MSKVFLKKFQSLAFKRNEYKALLTIDTDEPFAYLGKGLLRSIGGLFRDMQNNKSNAGYRYRIVAKGEKDPYEVFDYIIENIEKSNTDVRFFFPVGDHSKYDKNPSWKNDEYRNLIHSLSEKFRSGLHPSFYVAEKALLINTEADRLRTILGKEVLISRFHYIRLFMPQSYHGIKNAGITEDYSMGYPDEPGFRAGIARPYYFYDVSEDQQTNLKIVPFQIMDVTLYNYKKFDPFISKEVILKLINETRKVGGLFVSIWHNTSLLDNEEWQRWREVFEFMLKNQTTMIVYHKNNEIDREQWDNCIKSSPGVKPYAYSWYLDIMAPGWQALVDDDYDSVFPIPCFSKFGIQYVATPIFLQQLGAFSPDKPASQAIIEFLDYMPDIYRLIDLCWGRKQTWKDLR